MTPDELAANEAKLADMNRDNEALRVRIETLEADVAELTGRIKVRSDELLAIQRAAQAELDQIGDERASRLRERQLLLEQRKALKLQYGVLYEQVGRAKKEAERAAKQAEKKDG